MRSKSLSVCLVLFVLTVVAGGAVAHAQSTRDVVVIQSVDATTLNPYFVQDVPGRNIIWNVFDALIRQDNDMQVKPWLAESWEQLDDLTWEFRLRPGVTFHNGERVNTEAVKFSFDYMTDPSINPPMGIDSYFSWERIEIIDELTFRIVLTEPFPDLLPVLARSWILAPEYYSNNEPEYVARNPVGSGPFKFVEWRRDQRIVLEANDHHFNGRPAVDRIIFRPIGEVSTRIAELLTGGADIITNVPPDQIRRIENARNVRLAAVPGGRKVFVGIVSDGDGPLSDARVRRALNYAVDWDTINIALLQGYGERMGAFVPPASVYPEIGPYPYDPAKAKQLLAEAGYPNGFDTVLHTPSGRYIRDREIAMAVAANLAEIGVRTRLESPEWSVYVNMLNSRPHGLFLLGNASLFVPSVDASSLLPDRATNFTRWQNETYFDLVAQLDRESDDERRRELLIEIQRVVKDEAPWIFLWFQTDFYGVSDRINWQPRADEIIFLDDVEIVR